LKIIETPTPRQIEVRGRQGKTGEDEQRT